VRNRLILTLLKINKKIMAGFIFCRERIRIYMRDAKEIVRDILILKLGDKNTAETEINRLTDMVNGLDSDISGGMLFSQDEFIKSLQKQIPGETFGRTTLAMLGVIYKTYISPKSISMLGKLLFAEKAVQDDYTLILLYRLLEHNGLTIRAVPNGYNALRGDISNNRLLDFTEAIRTETNTELSETDLIKALFILNDEPDEDGSCVKDCSALDEYKRVVSEAAGMNGITLTNIPDYTSYPNTVLVMGLRVLADMGKIIDFNKDTFERLIISIMTKQPITGFAAGF
jgi:hypothetical protein